MDSAIRKIKDFENILKGYLIAEYGKYLPEDKLQLLKRTGYTTTDLLEGRSSSKVRRILLSRMLNDLIDMKVDTTVTLKDGNTLKINDDGLSLEDTLINFYSYEISRKYHFDIGQIDGLKEDLETVKALYEKLGDSLDISAFNEDAVKLLKKANIKEITEKYEQKELQQYFMNVTQVSAMGDLSKQEQNDLMKENTERELSIQIVWLHDKKHIKYTDQYGEVHLIDIDKSPSVEEYYKNKLANLGPDEKLDPEEFFYELQRYASEMEMISTNNVKEDELGSKEVNMLEFIKTTPALENARTMDIIKHNSKMDTHVTKADKNIITTEDKDDHVEASIIKDGSAVESDEITQNDTDISSTLISKDEYIRLRSKYNSGEELSDEEIEALRRADPVYAEEVFEDMVEEQEDGGVSLKPSNPYNSGFTFKTFALYFIVSLALLATTVLIIILK